MNPTNQNIQNKASPTQELKLVFPEEINTQTLHKSPENLHQRETIALPNERDSPVSTFKNDATPINVPIPKRSSFSDILAPHDIQTEANLSLEKELEKNLHKSLNTMPNRSK